MEGKLITSTEEFYSLKDDWEGLQEQDPDVTYYSTFEFNKAWWNVYKEADDKSLFIICIYHNNKVVGIAPFIIEERKKAIFSWKVLKFLGRGDYLGVIIDSKEGNELTIIKEIFKAIEKFEDKWDRIQLTHIKHNSLLCFYLLKSPQYNQYLKYLVECPCVYFNKYESFNEYEIIYSLKKTRCLKNRLVKKEGLNFKIINNKTDYDVYEFISKMHKEEQQFLVKHKNMIDRSSLFNDKYYSKFIKDIYTNNRNVLTFILEDNNGEILGYNTGYLYKRILYDWNCAYNPVAKDYSIGRILHYESIRYLFENRIADIWDFGAGRYPWKFWFTKDFIYDYQLDMWNLESEKGKKMSNVSKLKNKIVL